MTTTQDRYDFVNGLKNRYGTAITPAQVGEIEGLVNEFIANSTAKNEKMYFDVHETVCAVLFRVYHGHARGMDGVCFDIREVQ